MTEDNVIRQLLELRNTLKGYLQPEILKKLVEFVGATGGDHSMIERYVWFADNSENGTDCRYAKMAKHFFEEEQAKGIADAINCTVAFELAPIFGGELEETVPSDFNFKNQISLPPAPKDSVLPATIYPLSSACSRT